MKLHTTVFVAALMGLAGPLSAQTTCDFTAYRYPTNEIPMYGKHPTTEAQRQADAALAQSLVQRDVSRSDGARQAVRRGFEALRQGDASTAIRRFNQSWLLDSDNGAAYWGFAIVVAERDNDIRCADDLFNRAIQLLPKDADLHVDYGRFLGRSGRYDESISRFLAALDLNSAVRDAHLGLTISYFRLGNIDSSLHHAKLAMARGEAIDPRFIVSLECAARLLASGATGERVQAECR